MAAKKTAKDEPAKKKVWTGTKWTAEDYAKAGYATLSVRIGPVPRAHLEELRKVTGLGTTDIVRQALEAMWKKRCG